MGLSFLKRFPISKFLSVNLSGSGVSVSVGPSGLKLNHKLGSGKTRLSAGKYGVRYTKKIK